MPTNYSRFCNQIIRSNDAFFGSDARRNGKEGSKNERKLRESSKREKLRDNYRRRDLNDKQRIRSSKRERGKSRTGKEKQKSKK